MPRRPGACGVPSPGLMPAAPRTPVLDGICKARSSSLTGWPDARSAILNHVIGCEDVLNLSRGTEENRPRSRSPSDLSDGEVPFSEAAGV